MLTEFAFCVIDEVDSILIDEARTPLIISGPAEKSSEKYYQVRAALTPAPVITQHANGFGGQGPQVSIRALLGALDAPPPSHLSPLLPRAPAAPGPGNTAASYSVMGTHTGLEACSSRLVTLCLSWGLTAAALHGHVTLTSPTCPLCRQRGWQAQWKGICTTRWTRSRRAYSSLRRAMRRPKMSCRCAVGHSCLLCALYAPATRGL